MELFRFFIASKASCTSPARSAGANSGLDKVIAEIGIGHLVLETDAPYLAPVPFRGKRNLPEYIVKVAEKVAEVTGVSMEEVVAVTTRNSKTVFGI